MVTNRTFADAHHERRDFAERRHCKSLGRGLSVKDMKPALLLALILMLVAPSAGAGPARHIVKLSVCPDSEVVIPFEPGSASLDPAAQELVEAMYARYRSCEGVEAVLAIAGQAPTRSLARRRAASVEGALLRLGARRRTIRTQDCTPIATLDPYESRAHPSAEGGAVLYVFWRYLPQERPPSSFCYNYSER